MFSDSVSKQEVSSIKLVLPKLTAGGATAALLRWKVAAATARHHRKVEPAHTHT